MPTTPEVEAIAKHARALERLRIVDELLEDLSSDLEEKDPTRARLERIAVRLRGALSDLQ